MNAKKLIYALALLLLLLTPLTALAKHNGAYVQTGVLGSVHLDLGDSSRLFDVGPGVHLGVGYNANFLGVRGSFQYASQDVRNTSGTILQDWSFLYYGGMLDMMIFPLGAKEEMMFQPYVVMGMGSYFLDFEDLLGFDFDGQPAMAFNGGIGFDVNLTDNISVGMENSIRPMLIFDDNVFGSTQTTDTYFYTFQGHLTYRF